MSLLKMPKTKSYKQKLKYTYLSVLCHELKIETESIKHANSKQIFKFTELLRNNPQFKELFVLCKERVNPRNSNKNKHSYKITPTVNLIKGSENEIKRQLQIELDKQKILNNLKNLGIMTQGIANTNTNFKNIKKFYNMLIENPQLKQKFTKTNNYARRIIPTPGLIRKSKENIKNDLQTFNNSQSKLNTNRKSRKNFENTNNYTRRITPGLSQNLINKL